MGIFLGIDGGGSKTRCQIGDETSLLGSGTAGSSNLVRVGENHARQALQECIRQACAGANVVPADIQRCCAGVAGAARAEISGPMKRLVAEVLPGEIEVVGDMVIALEAAFGSGPGVVTIAGSGSIAYGRSPEGEKLRAGGWGFAISDEGSGYWIGHSAVAATMRAYDEAEPTTLANSLMTAWNVSTLDEFVLRANASPAPDFAALFPQVLKCADAGDPLARTLLTQAATELGQLAKIVIHHLFANAPSVQVAMSGGVFRSSALVRQVFYNSLRSEYSNASVNANVIEPVRGALELARKGTLHKV